MSACLSPEAHDALCPALHVCLHVQLPASRAIWTHLLCLLECLLLVLSNLGWAQCKDTRSCH